jgi:hypothetical protein
VFPRLFHENHPINPKIEMKESVSMDGRVCPHMHALTRGESMLPANLEESKT